MALTNEQIREVLQAKSSKRTRANTGKAARYFVREVEYDAHGNIRPGKAEWTSEPPPASIMGKYEGKAGSMRRSRKGVSTRQPNGRRYLLSSQPDMTGSTTQVLAYKV
jgi:hypothetical protein